MLALKRRTCTTQAPKGLTNSTLASTSLAPTSSRRSFVHRRRPGVHFCRPLSVGAVVSSPRPRRRDSTTGAAWHRSQHRNECALWWGVAAAAAACTACRATRTPAAPCPHVLPGCSSALPLCLPVPPTPTGNGVHRTPAPCTLRHALLAHSSAGGRCCATDPWGWQWAAAAADPVALEIHLSSSPGAWWPNRAAPAALHTRAAGGALQRPALGHDSC